MGEGFGAFAGGFANSLVNTMQKAQEQQVMQEYKKALIDQSKLQTKQLEAKLNLEQQEQNLLSWAMGQMGGGGGLPMPTPNPPGSPLPAGPPQVMGREIVPPSGSPFAPMAAPTGAMSDLVRKLALARGEDPNFALRMMQFESGGNPRAVSPKGAQGLFQFMPGTGARYNLNNPFDPEANANAFFAHTADNRQALQAAGIEPTPANLAAAHNAGVGAVQKYGGIPPYAETQKFVQNVTGGLPQQVAQMQAPFPAQAPGTQPVPTGNYPGGGPILTPRSFLEGYLKKKYGVEPGEVTYQNRGGHMWVMDKHTGEVKGIYPGQGEYAQVEQTLPDGSKVMSWQLKPPPPIPPGYPVFASPGQGGQPQPAGLGSPATMFQTAPPAYNYQEVKTPTGATNKVAIPQAQPGFSFQAEPPGAKIADAGRLNMIMQADSRMGEVNNLVFPAGKLDRSLLLKAAAPMGGIGEGSQLYSKMYQAVDSALRLETGAQANASEIEVKMREYWPSVKDTEATIRQKMKDLNEYVNGAVKLADPTGEIRKMRGQSPAMSVRYKYNPSTGKLEAVQ